MTASHALDVRFFESLRASDLTAAERDLAVDLCVEIVTMVQAMDLPHPGRAARSAAELMVGESVPRLDHGVLDDVARLCEVAVVHGP